MRKSCNGVGTGWGNQNQRGPACEFDMTHGSFSSWIQKLGMHWISRQCLKGHGRDKGLGTTGHDDPYLGAFIDQAAYQGGAFVGGYSAANTQQNALSVQTCHERHGSSLLARLRYSCEPCPMFDVILWCLGSRYALLKSGS